MFSTILRGINGEFELQRTLGAAGVVSFILGAHGFTAWSMARGATFDLAIYCTAFPAGLAAVLGASAGAIALKDRQVAKAKAEGQGNDPAQ